MIRPCLHQVLRCVRWCEYKCGCKCQWYPRHITIQSLKTLADVFWYSSNPHHISKVTFSRLIIKTGENSDVSPLSIYDQISPTRILLPGANRIFPRVKACCVLADVPRCVSTELFSGNYRKTESAESHFVPSASCSTPACLPAGKSQDYTVKSSVIPVALLGFVWDVAG